MLEYFISTHGARKGLADTALRTADSGYLTRRLIDVAQDVIVLEEDCGAQSGIWLAEPSDKGVLESLSERILGRYAASDVADPKTGEIIVERNEEIDEEKAQRIDGRGHRARARAFAAHLPGATGHLPAVLRPQPGARHAGRDERSGRHRRRAEHRRAGHAAHDAHLPHRRRRGPRHHQRSAPRGGAVRGAHPQGAGHHLRDRRHGRDRPGRRVALDQGHELRVLQRPLRPAEGREAAGGERRLG